MQYRLIIDFDSDNDLNETNILIRRKWLINENLKEKHLSEIEFADLMIKLNHEIMVNGNHE